MTRQEVAKAVNEILQETVKRLETKQKEYANEDGLHNFNAAAVIQGITPEQALLGMAAKHVISICDMCLGGEYTKEQWKEKIGDNIAYLCLLYAMVCGKE